MKARRTPGVASPRTPALRSRGLEPPQAKAKGSECRNERKPDRRRRRQGVNRPAAGCGDRREEAGGVRLPRRGRSHRTRHSRRSRIYPWASGMIPLESPVPEIGTLGSVSGGAETWLGTRVSEAPTDGESRRNNPKTATAFC